MTGKRLRASLFFFSTSPVISPSERLYHNHISSIPSMLKHSARTVHTACAIFLLVWTCLTSLQFLRTIIDRTQGNTSICEARAHALHIVTGHIHSIRASSATEQDLREAPVFLASASAQSRHRRLRQATSNLLRLSARCGNCPAVKPAYRTFEWSLASRYPLDGVLLYIFSVLGTRSRVAVEIDDGVGTGVYAGAAALSVLHGWDVMSLCRSWSGSNFARTMYADRSRLIEDRFPESVVQVVETRTQSVEVFDVLKTKGVAGEIDLLLMFLENGQEGEIFDKLHMIRPRVVVATYRDFLGPDAVVRRRANVSVEGTVLPRRGRDPLRPIPYAGYSVTALHQVAKLNSYRLVWCLAMFPIAVFVDVGETELDQFLPKLAALQCIENRYADSKFRMDMEALWQATRGEQWVR